MSLYEQIFYQYLGYLIQAIIVSCLFVPILTFRTHGYINRPWKFVTCITIAVFLLAPVDNLFLHIILTSIAFIVILHISFQESFMFKLFFYLLDLLKQIFTELCFALMIHSIFKQSYAAAIRDDTTYAVLLTFANMINLILAMCIVICWKAFVNKLRRKALLLFIILPVYQLILMLIFFANFEIFTSFIAMTVNALLIFSIILDWIMLSTVDSMIKKTELQKQISDLYESRLSELNYYEAVQKNVEEQHMVKHDLANHLQTAYMILENGSSAEGAREILDSALSRAKNIMK